MKLLVVVIFLTSSQVFAWGKQGHSIVNQTAAFLLADSAPEHEFLREHSFDLGYFANVPDIAWKQEKTYNTESPQHFMDMEIFEKALKIKGKKSLDEAFLLDREEFDAKYPKISVKAGRAWWRVREIYDLLAKQSQFLEDKKMSVKERHELQAQWLVLAGVLGHYVGDLSQPLHLSENFDGQMTSQKGVHSHFEDKMVNELVPKLADDVLTAAKTLWPEFSKKNRDASTLTLVYNLSEFSRSNLKAILAIDKKQKRKKASAKAYEKIIIDQLAQGALVTAELWRRNLNWKFNGQLFFTFLAIPDYIMPGTSQSAHVEEIK